jgi:hypothetical protein
MAVLFKASSGGGKWLGIEGRLYCLKVVSRNSGGIKKWGSVKHPT